MDKIGIWWRYESAVAAFEAASADDDDLYTTAALRRLEDAHSELEQMREHDQDLGWL